MSTRARQAPSFDFRSRFDSIARPGLRGYLEARGFDLTDRGDDVDSDDRFKSERFDTAQAYVRSLWRTLQSEQELAEFSEGVPPTPPIGSPPGTPAYIHPPWNAERAAAVAAELDEDAIDAERRVAADPKPVDVYRAVHLGTEMARKNGLEAGDEAVAYAADRLKSKIERDAVYNPVAEVNSAIRDYRFLKERRGGGKVVYIDLYKRRQVDSDESTGRRPRTTNPEWPKNSKGASKGSAARCCCRPGSSGIFLRGIICSATL